VLAAAITLLGFSWPFYPNALQAWGNNLAATAVIALGLAWFLRHPAFDAVVGDAVAGEAVASVLPRTSGRLQPAMKDQP
jgi:hypothetical protein